MKKKEKIILLVLLLLLTIIYLFFSIHITYNIIFIIISFSDYHVQYYPSTVTFLLI